MDDNTLISCLRATANGGEFDSSMKKKRVAESAAARNSRESKVEDDEDDLMDQAPDLEFNDSEDDLDPTAVIDPEITDSDVEDEEPSPENYIGKYIVICPICLQPLFSDTSKGEVFCPICNQQVEVESAVGKVVDPSDVATDEPEVDGDGLQGIPEGDDVIDDENEADSDDVEPDTSDPSNDVVDDEDPDEKEESLQAPPSNTDRTKYKPSDLDPQRTGGDAAGVLADYKDGKISDKEFNKYVAESDTTVSVCPEGGVAVENEKVVVTVAPASKCDEGEEALPVEDTAPIDASVELISEENPSVEVDDFDTDSFDDEVNEIVPQLYDDDSSYESVKVSRKDSKMVIEGVVSKKDGASRKVRFTCSDLKANKNEFKAEGFDKAMGKIIVETKYVPRSKRLKVESATYKFLAKVNGTVKVLKK